MREVEGNMQRAFKGVWIPADIWLSEDLTLQEKVFLAEIDSLDNENGCFASNKYFAKFFGLTNGRCSQVITSLKNKGLINIEYIYGPNKEIEKRVIKVVNKLNTPIKYPKEGVKDIKDPYLGNAQDNNPCINNPYNNTSNKDSHVRDIFNHYLSKNIVNHQKVTSAMRTAINARLRDYSYEQLVQAIDNYATVYHGDGYWFNTKYTLADLMRDKDVRKFIDDADPFNNFREGGRNNGVHESRGSNAGHYGKGTSYEQAMREADHARRAFNRDS